MNPITSNNPGHPMTLMLWDTNLQDYRAAETSDFDVSKQKISQGPYHSLPANNANGTELSGRPAVTSGVRFELATSATITYFIASTGSTPNNVPALTKTLNIAGTTEEPLAGADSIFVTASTGTAIFRWIQK